MDVPDPEAFFRADAALDVAVARRVIYISPNEIYSMHSLLLSHIDAVVRRAFSCFARNEQ